MNENHLIISIFSLLRLQIRFNISLCNFHHIVNCKDEKDQLRKRKKIKKSSKNEIPKKNNQQDNYLCI